MSNIAGKAYAMNLVTPVYVKTGWLNIFFVPGIALLITSIAYFMGHRIALVPWYFSFSSIVGLIFLVSGFLTWIGISAIPLIGKINEFKQFFYSLVFYTLAIVSTLSCISASLFGVLGLVLIIVGLLFLKSGVTWLNKFIFWMSGFQKVQDLAFQGLITLSLIHYARWVILRDFNFPNLGEGQPKENLKYGYMFFFSNFNGSWTQYVDSFSVAIPSGLNLIWNKNVGWKDANVETPFNGYVTSNQIETEHYYNAYPLASSNDVKSAQKVQADLLVLASAVESTTAEEFKIAFDKVLLNRQADLSQMEPSPIVSLANEAVERREQIQKGHSSKS